MASLTFAFCTFNRAARLPRLVAAMRTQTCPVPFEILAVNNNSSDDTAEVLADLAALPGVPLRWVTEPVQGIVAARNRAITEALGSDVLVFIDDDELPQPGLLATAADAILNEGAQCAGGRVEVDFSGLVRPPWLEDNLLGFLAEVNHGNQPMWIVDDSTPIWTANIAYDMRLFRVDAALRFDHRYDRQGQQLGGGEDLAMLRTLLGRSSRVRYRPDMAVLHSVDAWRLRRSYFLKLHFQAGLRRAIHELPDYPGSLLGVPPFMLRQFAVHCARTLVMAVRRQPGLVRQAMNAAFAWGTLVGYRTRTKP
ncbi:MAG: glycosyltransferase [Burkholderiales bacterium PBB1]|nr:MAG: glycosyltransferase [Burkholderiales bacterium PBB1]